MPNVIIPTDTIFGVKIEGATERVLSRIKKEEEEKALTEAERLRKTSNSTQQIDNFIYVPSINLYVAKQRSLYNRDWHQAHQKLQGDGKRMPTIPEFIEFLKYTKDNFPEIYNEITEARNSYEAEWLDAYFEQRKDGMYILTGNKTKAEKLESCLVYNCYADLSSFNKHGLLTQESSNQNYVQGNNVYFRCPKKMKQSRSSVLLATGLTSAAAGIRLTKIPFSEYAPLLRRQKIKNEK